ncbi:MAG: nucleoside kinase [Sphaerochaetaceae bacterium]|nr:nucleoside kinase [Sphaerochaetaceae bacterium]MDC7247990.1 nucleoside kinase [Sphaerochaetaceae bacterium]
MNRAEHLKDFRNHLITITYNGEDFKVKQGTTVEQFLRSTLKIIKDDDRYQDNPIVAIKLNNDVMSFGDPIVTDGTADMVKAFSNIGKRMYRHTLSFLLSYASQKVFPDRRLVIGHALGDGLYFNYDGLYSLEEDEVNQLREALETIVKSSLPIRLYMVSYQQATDYFEKMGYTATKKLLNYRNDPYLPLYACEDFIDISFEPLLPSSHLCELWQLMGYQERGLLLRYPLSSDFTRLAPFTDNPLLFSIFRESKIWGNILKVDCLGAMNDICGSPHIQQFIRMNENLQGRKIAAIADQISEKGAVKVVFIAGPSSSGKTTFTRRLSLQLRMLGYNPVQISLDNYYRSKDQAPRDKDGKADLEALEALDLSLFRQNIDDLYAGREIIPPRFEFNGNGVRHFDSPPVSLTGETILLIEGIHGLNPNLIPKINSRTTFKIYISALTQLNLDDHNRISTTDNRILRRIVRDHKTRGTSARMTLEMWPSVERGERKHIFPYQNEADAMINSALEYELAVLKPYAEPLLKTVKNDSNTAYSTARRLLDFLENVYPIPATYVPSESLLREFIGGSEFNVT